MPPKPKLTPKQELFCLEYLKDLNATQAAIRAGYSKKTAKEIGYEHLTKPHIETHLQSLNEKRFKKVEKEGQVVIDELLTLATSDLQNYVDVAEGGGITVKTFEDMPKGASKALSSITEKRTIKENEDGSTSVNSQTTIALWDKNKALANLGRHYKLFTDKIEVGPSDTLSDLLKQSRERAGE